MDPAIATEDNSKDKNDRNFVIFQQVVSLRLLLARSSAFHSGKSPLVCASYFSIRYQQGVQEVEQKLKRYFYQLL